MASGGFCWLRTAVGRDEVPMNELLLGFVTRRKMLNEELSRASNVGDDGAAKENEPPVVAEMYSRTNRVTVS